MSERAAEALASIAQLLRDPEPAVRSIGAALTAAVCGGLDDHELGWVRAIEGLRASMEASTEEIDTALVNNRGVEKPASLADTCQRRSKKEPWGVFLLALARGLGPSHCLELGTCLGISAAYLAAGLRLSGGGRLATLEGAPALAERSRGNLAALGLGNVDVVPGLFAATLPGVLGKTGEIGLAFIDGHHQEEPTLAYFETVMPSLAERAVVVFDDIRWSDGMEKAWKRIVEHPHVAVAIDLTTIGVCVVRPAPGPPARQYALPSLSSMRAAVPSAVSVRRYEVPSDRPARLHWGCGRKGTPGWVNADARPGPNVDIVGDIRQGLPLDDAVFECAVSIHALQEVLLPDIPGVLAELRRVLKPGGALRLSVPDLDRNIDAYRAGHTDHFLVGDADARSLGGKFITQVLWFGYTVTLFTAEFLEELLRNAGFTAVRQCEFKETSTGIAGIVDLDDREGESLFMEAVK